jgi:hypothetical protein
MITLRYNTNTRLKSIDMKKQTKANVTKMHTSENLHKHVNIQGRKLLIYEPPMFIQGRVLNRNGAVHMDFHDLSFQVLFHNTNVKNPKSLVLELANLSPVLRKVFKQNIH